MKKIITILRFVLGVSTFALSSMGSLYAYTTIDGTTNANDRNQFSLREDSGNCRVTTNKFLKLGVRDSGDSLDVTSLQTMLIERGYMKGRVTGFFGKTTLIAVKEFQKNKGISSTGVVGPVTLAKIKGEVCPPVKGGVQGNGDGTEINPLNTYTPPKNSTIVCNSEQYLKDGKCQSFTYTCPNGRVLSGYPKGNACGTDIESSKVNGTMCSYPAPPMGCTYVQGPSFNSQTSCGLVLSCSSQNEDTVKAEGGPQSENTIKARCPLIRETLCVNGGSTTMDPVTCQITYCDGTKSLPQKEAAAPTGIVLPETPTYALYYCNGVISHNPCKEVPDPSSTYMETGSCPMMMTLRCSDGTFQGRDPRTCVIIPCGTSEKVIVPVSQDDKTRALLEAKRLDDLTKKSYITDLQRILLVNQRNEVLMNAGVSQ